MKVTLHDLQGHRISTWEPAGPLTRLRLPAGTYVVTASHGIEERSYTLALRAGASFELHVDPL